jgi:hypothetical protein
LSPILHTGCAAAGGTTSTFLGGVFPAALERALAGRLDPVRLALTTGLAPPSGGLGPAELFEWFGASWYRLAARRSTAARETAALLRDNADHIHQARRVLNATADRYLMPVTISWLSPPD